MLQRTEFSTPIIFHPVLLFQFRLSFFHRLLEWTPNIEIYSLYEFLLVQSPTLSEIELTRQEQRSYMKIAVLRGRNAQECHSELPQALGNRALPYSTVARWADAFQRGRVASADMRRTGRSRTVRTDVARAIIVQCLQIENLLNNIITIDETWVRAYEPELERQSAEWRHEGSPRRQISSESISCKVNNNFDL